MMVRRITVPLLGAFFLVMAFNRPAEACTCSTPGPACQATWDASAVFVGQVVEAQPPDQVVRDPATPFAQRRVRLRIVETFRGPTAPMVDVYTGLGGGDCGYDFVAGRTYLVYASESSGRYLTGICQRTRPVEQASEDLDYLRGFGRTPSALAAIRGTVLRWDPDQFGQRTTRLPYAGARVVAEGNGTRHETQTRADGTYDISVPTGEYRLTIDLPQGLYATMPPSVNVRDVRGCAQADIGVRSDGRISGRLLNANGEPLAGTGVSVVRPSPSYQTPGRPAPRLWLQTVEMGTTKADGSFEITRVPPGTYALGVRTLTSQVPGGNQWVLYPGTLDFASATSVTLAIGERRAVGDFTIPAPLEIVYISGVVRDREGRPVSRANVTLTDAARPQAAILFSRASTDADGRFRLPAHVGQQYGLGVTLFVAARQLPRTAAVPPFEAARNLPPIEITLAD